MKNNLIRWRVRAEYGFQEGQYIELDVEAYTLQGAKEAAAFILETEHPVEWSRINGTHNISVIGHTGGNVG